MNYNVLIVDDSLFHRKHLRELIEQDSRLHVIDQASNGKEALEKVMQHKPDIITMDVEMPILDGISAVRRIMKEAPTPILMFSSLTKEGAQQTLEALDAGALDFLPKDFETQNSSNNLGLSLRSKLVSLARKRHTMRHIPSKIAKITNAPKKFLKASSLMGEPPKVDTVNAIKKSGKSYACLAIGSSTGGPVALQNVLRKLPEDFPLPILIAQHMPGTFTDAFADRLNSVTKITVSLAKEGERLVPGHAYVAPGGRQLFLSGSASSAKIKITDVPDQGRVLYKPSVDLMFESIAGVFGASTLGVILTGMGNDGTQGAKTLKSLGATIWAQDEVSSVVYGMPGAVTKAGVVNFNIPLENLSQCIKTEVM